MTIKSEILFEDDKVYHKTTQPAEDLILERNAELRKNPGVIQDLGGNGENSWGRQVASIPFIIWEKAIRDGYWLNCPDSKIAEQEMHRFLMSEDGKKCLVQGK